jgi:hypothetical protein
LHNWSAACLMYIKSETRTTDKMSTLFFRVVIPRGLVLDTNVSEEHTASVFRIFGIYSTFLSAFSIIAYGIHHILYLQSFLLLSPSSGLKNVQLRCLRTLVLSLIQSY